MKKVVGLGGVARAGKDTFAAILEKNILQAGKSVLKIALAAPLKQHCDGFLKNNLGISAYTSDPQEKLLIRPMLVWYGDVQRKRTNGRYWIDLAKKTIDETNFDYYIVTDVRYNAYEKDELYFLKNEVNGTLCHISKYTVDGGKTTFVPPANDHEAINDPKIKNGSDYKVEWPHIDLEINTPEELIYNPTLNEYVEKFMQDCKIL